MLDRIRNIGIIAHVDAGKTTTTERILYFSGSKHRAGDVDRGNTTTDSDPLERAKGITINSAAVTVGWKGASVTLIDTPGHVDFTAEVERSLRVLDGAVCVFCAAGGVQVQSETVWFQADRHGVPRLAFINKMDRMGADFHGCVRQLADKLGAVPAVAALPVGQGGEFQGVVDLVEMRFILRDPDDPSHKRSALVDIPASSRPEAERARRELLETAALVDDEVMRLLLEDRPVPTDLLRAALRKGTLARRFTPVLCGSAQDYHGVELLLDAVVAYLPSPRDRGAVIGTKVDRRDARQVALQPDPAGPFAGLAFKTAVDKDGRDLIYLRIYSGELRPKDRVLNPSLGRYERVGHLYRMMGDRGVPLEAAGPGEIVTLVGLEATCTGHTLCDPAMPVALEEIRFPEPVIAQALHAGPHTDEARLAHALARLVRDDPTLKVRTDPETKELILSGMGELHLEVSVDKLRRTPGVEVEAGRPRVAYCQTLSRPVEVETRFIKQHGGSGMYAVIRCRFEPLGRSQLEEIEAVGAEEGGKADGENRVFVSRIVGGVVSKEYIPGVESGFRAACRKGARHGFPCVGVRCTLVDGKEHEKDSSREAFHLAAQECTREAQERAGITLLEPIMSVVVTAPSAHQGKLTGDVQRRRGTIQNFSSAGGRCRIHAHVPLAELFGYASDLSSGTGGTASFSMEPSHYAPVKEELADLRRDA